MTLHRSFQTLAFIDKISLPTLLIIALTLGLAPFVPEPHIWEKLKMLFSGTLTKPLDIFDMIFHGVPWLLLGIKLLRRSRSETGNEDHS